MVFDLEVNGSGSESQPRTAAESSVTDICRACLGRPRLGIDEPIDMAGYSGEVLSSLAQRLADEFGVELRSGLLAGVTTVRELSGHIEGIVFAELDSLFGVDGTDEPSSAPHDGPGRPVLSTAHEMFEAWAARTPDATALVFQDASLTYAELDAEADRLARRLRGASVRRGDVLGILVPRSMLLVTSVLAVLKTGATFSVLDMDFPVERHNEVLDVAGIAAVLTYGSPPAGLDCAGIRVFDVGADSSEVADGPADGGERAGPADTACAIFTSGSTGRPKGVLATHRSLTATLTGQDYASFAADETWLQCSPVSWDAFLLELFAPLVSGSACVLQPGQRPEPQLIVDLVLRHGVTTMHASATLLNFLIDEHIDLFANSTLRHVLTGGEAASPAHLAKLLAAAPHLRVVNGYSPVECMIFTATHRVRPADTRTGIPVGRAVPGKRVYVLDRNLNPVPPGGEGEVYMAGAGLAHGYVRGCRLTAERFVACPFDAPGERMYRTGDLARWNRDGNLELLGRSDDQIKVRGHRIEPSGIDAALHALPGVWRSATILREDRRGDKRLVSYVVAAPGSRPDTTELRAALARTLPDYLVPNAIIALDELPMTPNGKLDRTALPAPAATRSLAGPRGGTPREEVLRTLFAEVLDGPDVGVDDDFFDLGGHSMLVTTLVSRIKRVMNAEIKVRDVFEHPTVAGLARCLSGAERAVPPLIARERPAVLPLSPGQKRLWFIHRFEGPSATYNIPVTIGLSGPLDVEALEAALRDVVERHEVLRTVFDDTHGEPRQLILPVPDTTLLERHTVVPQRLNTALADAAGDVFDLTAHLPIRARLFTVGASEHTLLLVVHHIAADGLSMRPLIADLTAAYTARSQHRAPAWRPLAVQYADYTLWLHDVLGNAADPRSLLSRQLAYWRETLSDLPEEIRLPADRPRPEGTAGAGSEVEAGVGASVHRRLADLARSENLTLFMIAQAAVAVVLHLNGAGTRIPLGTVVAGRADDALQPLVGFFVNTVVLPVDLGGNPTLGELLGRVRVGALSAYSHQDAPFDRVVDELNPRRSSSRHPLFQTMVAFAPQSGVPITMPGLRARVGFADADAAAKFDLGFTFRERRDLHGRPAGLTIHVAYHTGMFDESTARRLAGAVGNVLGALADRTGTSLGDLPAVTAAEFDLLIRRWNATTAELPALPSVHELVEAQSNRTPRASALVFGDRALTYRELDESANRLAHHMIFHGAKRGDVVGIDVPRGPALVISLLAALKAGCAYLLVDPTHPAERRHAVLGEARVALLVTSGRAAGAGRADDPGAGRADDHGRAGAPTIRLDDPTEVALIAEAPATRPAVPVGADDLAAIMFTSGSTGRPKGVAAPHRAIVATHTAATYLDHGPHHVFIQCSPVSWDAFALEVFSALFHGGTCVLQPGQSPDLASIEELTERHPVTLLQLSTALFNAVVDEDSPVLARIPHIMIGGEAASAPHVERALVRQPGLRLTNGYGPVESLGFTTVHDVARADIAAASIPIGRPIANKRAYVLDAVLRPVAPGVVGELYVAGHGIAHGYIHQPVLTAERFVPDPFAIPGRRMYRTGDLARWTRDGLLEFVGRSDDQMKIRGFRIEPAEIEAALHRLPGVDRAAVAADEGRTGEQRLVAYVVAADGSGPGIDELRAGLRRTLPDYLVPSVFVPLDALPLNANGKLDRRALPVPAPTGEPDGNLAPRNQTEHAIAEVWARVLGVDRVGVHDNFFALGGDSIACIRVVSRLRKAGIVVTPRTMFERQTVAELAAAAEHSTPFEAEQGVVSGPVPLTPIQCWFFAQNPPAPDHFNQSTVLAVSDLDPAALARALDALAAHHDVLRTRFVRNGTSGPADVSRAGHDATAGPDTGWRQEIRPDHPGCVVDYEDLGALPPQRRETRWAELAENTQAGLDLASGRLVRALLADLGSGAGQRLLLTVHHLVVDIVSWSILIEDLQTAYRQIVERRTVELPAKSTSFRSWSHRLHEYATSSGALAELDLWTRPPASTASSALRARIGVPEPGDPTPPLSGRCHLRLAARFAADLVHAAPAALGVGLEDVILSALALALCRWSGDERVLIDVEGHGREQVFTDMDISRTVGWFTTLHPVDIAVPAGADAIDVVHDTAAGRELVPHKGIGFGVLAHLAGAETRRRIAARPPADVVFNFHGTESVAPTNAWRELPGAPAGPSSHPDNVLPHAVSVDAAVRDDELVALIAYRVRPDHGSAGSELRAHFEAALREIAVRINDGTYVKRVSFAPISPGDAARIAERFN